MLKEFKKIELTDKRIFDEYYSKFPQYSSYLSFVSLFTWQSAVNFRFIEIEGNPVVRFESYTDKKEHYLLPETDRETTKLVMDALIESGEVSIYNLTKKQVEIISDLYPDKFTFTHKRNSDNYYYTVEDMSTLKGKKLHSKRNFVNRFKKDYEYSYEKIDGKVKMECLELLDLWCEKKECANIGVASESLACKLALMNMEALSLIGGALRVDGKIVAFSLGERYNDETVIIHFEKADTHYKGAFQTIFMEFTKNEWSDLKLVNREEDMGAEGLRKAKLSYYPCFMLEMYDAVCN